jgi:hypothetical protein
MVELSRGRRDWLLWWSGDSRCLVVFGRAERWALSGNLVWENLVPCMSFHSVLHGGTHPLLIVQWSPDQGPLPLLQSIIRQSSRNPNQDLLLISLLHPPKLLLPQSSSKSPLILDFTAHVPGYHPPRALDSEILSAIDDCERESVSGIGLSDTAPRQARADRYC